MSNLCPVCRNPSQITYSSVSGGYSIECPRCGHYFTNDIDIDDFHNALGQDWVKLSGFLCNNKRFILKYSNFKELISKTRMPTPSEKADNILLYLGEKFKTPGTMIDLTSDSSKIIPKIEGLGYIENFDEEKYLLRDYLEKEKGLLRYKPNCLIITPKGWDYISKLLKPNQNSNTAFIAMWFSPKVEGTRKSIKQAIRDAGYEPKIVNEEPFNGDIVNQIITFINQSRFVVADLTEQRQGVYFEAGYAKGLNLPVIYTVRDNQIDPKKPTKENPDLLRVHFDLNHQNLISWNNKNLAEFQSKLTNQITATIGIGPLKKEN